MGSILRTSLHRPATQASSGVRGATGSAADSRRSSGAGRALRSTLPLGVSGISGSTTIAVGSMYSGSDRARVPRNVGQLRRAGSATR